MSQIHLQQNQTNKKLKPKNNKYIIKNIIQKQLKQINYTHIY